MKLETELRKGDHITEYSRFIKIGNEYICKSAISKFVVKMSAINIYTLDDSYVTYSLSDNDKNLFLEIMECE